MHSGDEENHLGYATATTVLRLVSRSVDLVGRVDVGTGSVRLCRMVACENNAFRSCLALAGETHL